MNEKSQVWRNASARYPITIEDNGVERMITEENARSLLRDLQGVLYPAMRADREIPGRNFATDRAAGESHHYD